MHHQAVSVPSGASAHMCRSFPFLSSVFLSLYISSVNFNIMAPSVADIRFAVEQPASKRAKPNPVSDPIVYDIQHQKFLSDGLPTTASDWLNRARQVSEIFAVDAAARDIENKSPKAEVALLKSAGLTKVLGPKKYGGGGQTWEVAYKVIREVAKGDGSLGMLLGYHLLWSTTANVVGNEEQKERVQKLIIENNYFVGGMHSVFFEK